MEAAFYVLLHLRTSEGFENFGRFEMGCDRNYAYSLFGQLEGKTHVTEKDSLIMELMETRAGLPLNLKIIGCTLDQLAANCRLLTKEIFIMMNLKQS
jgi:hypothetical protein